SYQFVISLSYEGQSPIYLVDRSSLLAYFPIFAFDLSIESNPNFFHSTDPSFLSGTSFDFSVYTV
ncbi:hypothetical protein DFH28DRAFT_828373, partial [Melampsora americana]